MKKIVVTGYSTVTPLGDNFQKLYANSNASYATMSQVATNNNFGETPVGVVEDAIIGSVIEDRERTKFDRISIMATYVIKELIERTGIADSKEALENTGIISGSGFGSVMSSEVLLHELYDKGHDAIDPMKFPHTSHNYPISIGAIKYKIKGPITAFVAANGAGFTALSFAKNLIESGAAPRIIVIGVEEINGHLYKYLNDSEYLGKPLGTNNIEPEKQVFVCEGCAGILLESEESAIERNAKILCEITSGTVSNGGKQTSEDKIFNNLRKTLERATSLKENKVGVYISNYDGINENLKTENAAIQKLEKLGYKFDQTLNLKPLIGNYLGASGLMEMAFILKELEDGMQNVRGEDNRLEAGSYMILNYGLGGNICSILLSCN